MSKLLYMAVSKQTALPPREQTQMCQITTLCVYFRQNYIIIVIMNDSLDKHSLSFLFAEVWWWRISECYLKCC